jgi:predicted transcriptional regulator of viral defense system
VQELKLKKKAKTKNWGRFLRALEKHEIISRRELRKIVETHLGMGIEYVVSTLKRNGHIKKAPGPRRGLYLVVKAGSDGSKNRLDIVESIQAHYGHDVLFCYGSALLFHGLSRYGELSSYYVASNRSKRPVNIRQATLHFVQPPVKRDLARWRSISPRAKSSSRMLREH